MFKLENFRGIISDKEIVNIYHKAKKLQGKSIVNLNATYQGGGVAEILYSLVLLMNDIGIDTEWRVLNGSSEFFNITKNFHNALQGAEFNFTDSKKKSYLQTNDNFSKFTKLNHDCIIIHDPQPLSLINSYKKQQPWIWRCHIDLTNPHSLLWNFLKNFIFKYDKVIFSSEKYKKDDLYVDQKIISPAINPLNYKNCEMGNEEIKKYIEQAGIPTDKPIITQVSRLDPWKDPEGVIEVYKTIKEKIDCRLLFCYNVASDDPETIRMYNKVANSAQKYIDNNDIVMVVGDDDRLVNAIQRFSDVIIQKSTREGFCLCVTEALWKGTPVVASNVGGIPIQIEDGVNGYLLEPKDINGFAEKIIYMLKNKKDLAEMGKQAKESVRKNFLITRLLKNYLDIIKESLD